MTTPNINRSEWVFHRQGTVMIVQTYGELDAVEFRRGRSLITEEASEFVCERILVDFRPARVLLSDSELVAVIKETAGVPYQQPVGMLVREPHQMIAFRHAFAMALRGLSRLCWTDPYDALEWAGLESLPPFKSAVHLAAH